MKVSVTVLTYNRARLVTEAIDSILNQTFRDFEVIVVDNYSSDNTESVVRSYTDERIRYFKNQNDGFIGVNRNYSIEKSRGEYIAFLDDDDLWLPEKLEKQIELLDSDRRLGLVYSDIFIMDSNGDFRKHPYSHSIEPLRGYVFNQLLQANFIPMPAVVVRGEVLDKVGGFNPKYKICLDYDLWLRIARSYPIDYVEQPLATFRVHSGGGLQANLALAYREKLQITEYWLKKKLGFSLRLKRGIPYLLSAGYHAYKYRTWRAVKELVKLMGCIVR